MGGPYCQTGAAARRQHYEAPQGPDGRGRLRALAAPVREGSRERAIWADSHSARDTFPSCSATAAADTCAWEPAPEP